MRIGIDASRATRAERTGTEGYSLQLIRRLLAIDSESQYLLYFNQPPPPGLLPESPQRRDRVLTFPRLWTHLRLSAEMAFHPPDLLFVPAHVLPLVCPRRTVVTVHDLGYLHEPQAHRLLDRLYLDLSARYHARVATRLLAISQATRDDLVRHYGVRPERVSVTYLAADETYAPVPDMARIAGVKARCGIAGEYLLFVGTLQPRKNLVRLVRAFAEATGSGGQSPDQPEHPPPLLVLAGKKGWWSGELMGVVKELGLEGRVVFPGYVPASDLPALYSGATAFVFPSLYEGFGMPVLEAMACGTPVLAANVSSLPEVVGDAGLLVDPTDTGALAAAMRRLVDDAALRSELRRRGLARAGLFSWERCARETLAALRQALDLA